MESPFSRMACMCFEDGDFIHLPLSDELVACQKRTHYAMYKINMPMTPGMERKTSAPFSGGRHPPRDKFPFEKHRHSRFAGDLHSNRSVKFRGDVNYSTR